MKQWLDIQKKSGDILGSPKGRLEIKAPARNRRNLVLGAAAVSAPALAGLLLLSGWLTSEEEGVPGGSAEALIQAPRMAIDMVPSGNAYDAAVNSMSVGQTDYCLETAPPGNNESHTHVAQIVITGVEDLVGWQARLNYEGAQMRPMSVTFDPFQDGERAQNVSFVNLPIDSVTGNHRGITGAANIPPSAVGPQTALIGSAYVGSQNLAVSPDTPAKLLPDDSSYSAPNGGVVAQVLVQVHANRAGPDILYVDLDDGSPNAPGSRATVFTGSGTSEVDLLAATMGDGFHAEGAACPILGGVPTVDPGVIPPVSGGEGGTSVVPPGVTIPPEPPLPQPSYITIKGRQVPLAPGMTYGRVGGTGDGPPGATPPPTPTFREVWEVTYDSNAAEPGYSLLSFDENYNILSSHIRAEDQDEFQPILDALSQPQ